jgi:hypothetical protein
MAAVMDNRQCVKNRRVVTAEARQTCAREALMMPENIGDGSSARDDDARFAADS